MGNNITNAHKISHSRMGKFERKPYTHTEHWTQARNYYRASKLTKKLIDRIGLQGLAELSGYSTSCISTIERMKISDHYLFAMQRIERQLNETL